MSYDFDTYGPPGINNNLAIYRSAIPNEHDYWSKFLFSDTHGNSNKISVTAQSSYSGPLPSQYPGLYTTKSPIYRVTAQAQHVAGRQVAAAVQADVLLALVPITQYAIFFNGLLEFSTCAAMTVNGRVHANGAIYTGTSASLTFNGTVTTTSTISSPAWNGQGPTWTSKGTYKGSPQSRTNVPTVSLSIGNTNVNNLIDMPAVGESPTSTAGIARLYNQASTVILVSNNIVKLVIQQAIHDQVPGADPSPVIVTSSNTVTHLYTNFPFLTLSNSFTDQRESKTIRPVDIDIAKYALWIKTNTSILSKFPANSGTYPTILYVADNRTNSATQLSAVRILNGSTPPLNGGMGFSLATPNPLYVKGHYNCTNATYLGTTNTVATVPCAFMSDALTILSSSWTDSASAGAYASRVAANTTVNAAILTGIVKSTGSTSTTFSGGIHNLPRLLEDWNGKTLTLNTSIMSLFNSTKATHQFINPGTYYNPPTRQFSFDLNFYDPAKQPPGIPCALVLIRYNWTTPVATAL